MKDAELEELWNRSQFRRTREAAELLAVCWVSSLWSRLQRDLRVDASTLVRYKRHATREATESLALCFGIKFVESSGVAASDSRFDLGSLIGDALTVVEVVLKQYYRRTTP